MTFEQLKRIVAAIKSGSPLPPLHRGDANFYMHYEGKVVGKERPRMGQHSVYTAKETREFEKAVKGGALKAMARDKLGIIRTPVSVHLSMTDEIPLDWPVWKQRIANAGYIIDQSGADLDNREKAILDAINRVVYLDDRQVVQVYKFRSYTPKKQGFELSVTPIGLTKNDLDNIEKMMRA